MRIDSCATCCGEVLQKQQRRSIRPVQIIDQEDMRCRSCATAEERQEIVEQKPALLLGRQIDRAGDVRKQLA